MVISMLDVDDITVSYGEISALHGVSLTVEEGEIVTVIGANGAGKTTLLRTISGLNRPSSGRIAFRGQEIHTLSPDEIARRGVIHVPEGRHIFPELTVEENLRLGTFARRDGDQVADLDHVYDIFPRLEERTQQRGESLSGGEQQMLAIGRALMSDPDLLLLDEPSLGLAPQIIEDVRDVIERLNEEGITILLIEQNARVAMELASRAYVLQNGAVRVSGDTDELSERDDIRESYLGI
jgi:branched-chain amino acid transport system ATP-binding protein